KRTITKYESQLEETPFAKGSNGMALRGPVMEDDLTTLIVNSHQPVDGQNAWYEAHVVSDEGWNFIGATFPGGITPFLGTNEHLGWTHTLNYPDFTDVYKLVMHPDEKLKYRFDGEWYDLEERKFKFKVKVAGIKLPISRTFYWSKYGATLKTKDGFYSVRFPANMGIGSGEQWYRMNKAQNFNEFEDALRLQGISGINVIYADDKDNIYYLSNGHLPKRASGYNWKEVLPGDTSRTLWKPNWKPIDSLPQYFNPECGWLFNTNNSPFLATCEENNLDPRDFDSKNGHLLWHNNRSLRYSGLVEDALSNTGKMSYEKLKEIKYDTKWGDPAYSFLVTNLDTIFHMDPAAHPKIADALKVLNEWDRNSNPENTGAGLFSLVVVYALEYLVEEGRILFPNELNEEEFEEIITDAQKHMKKHFGDLNTPLGEIQRLVRGKQDWPVGGNVDVLAALNTAEWKGGKRRAAVADCYIQFVRYTPEGVLLETVNTFGASNREGSPHYADQVELYLNHQLKPMTLDWDAVKKAAKLTYYPGQIDYNKTY
ncbi:MAG: acyl-homoserine-lactone acylase, partial [Limisphaerales bacterium]